MTKVAFAKAVAGAVIKLLGPQVRLARSGAGQENTVVSLLMIESDFIIEELPAIYPDGRRITVVVRIGKPFKDAPADDPHDDTHVCPVQLQGIDDEPFRVYGEGPIQALHLGLSTVQVDLKYCQDALGLRFIWPDGTTRDVTAGWWNGGRPAG